MICLYCNGTVFTVEASNQEHICSNCNAKFHACTTGPTTYTEMERCTICIVKNYWTAECPQCGSDNLLTFVDDPVRFIYCAQCNNQWDV